MKAKEKLNAARIQNAVTGLSIPMMTIPKLYRVLEAAVAEGKTDAELKLVAAAFLKSTAPAPAPAPKQRTRSFYHPSDYTPEGFQKALELTLKARKTDAELQGEGKAK